MAGAAAVAGGGSACGVVVGNGDDRRRRTLTNASIQPGFWAVWTVWYLLKVLTAVEFLCVLGSRGYLLYTVYAVPVELSTANTAMAQVHSKVAFLLWTSLTLF